MFRYTIQKEGDAQYGRFLVDVNGNGKPNIVGRDYFGFFINSKGHLVDYPLNQPMTYSYKIEKCKSDYTQACYFCYSALVDSGWKMDY